MQQIHLIKKKNKDILGIIENIIVELKGEPSYTSGDQKWNGAHAILNNNVDVTHNTPAKIKYLNSWSKEENGNDNNKLKLLKFNVPKHPYNKLHPNKKNPEIKAPEIKYFKPASVENDESRLKLDNM